MLARVFAILFLFNSQLFASAETCLTFYKKQRHETKVSEILPMSSHSTVFEVESFMDKSFRNADFLLEFFGPLKNSFRDWLKWLESDDTAAPQPTGPGLYIGGNRIVIAKQTVYPIDAGISQFSNEDVARRTITPIMQFHNEQITRLRGSSQEAVDARKSLFRKLDTLLFGIYGALKSDTHENLVMRTTIGGDHILNSSLYSRHRIRIQERMFDRFKSDFKPPHSPIDDFKKIAHVISETPDKVTVKIKLNPSEALNQNQQLIQRMFFITHWQMVQKSYRESGLFKDDIKSALYLLDDFIKSMEESKGQEDIYLMYERDAWENIEYRISLAHRYASVELNGLGLQPFQYQTIADAFYPFYPTYGIIVDHHTSGELEFKRLFHNNNPDPLEMLRLPKDEHDHSKQFYYDVTTQLPVHSTVMAVSKTSIHTRFYRMLGFKLQSSVFNPEWQTNKDILTQDRENFLEKLKPKKQTNPTAP